MKKTLTMMLLLLSLTANAQKDKGATVNEQFLIARVSELALRLEMTDEQKAKFVSVYRRYSEEMTALWCGAKKGKGAKGDDKKPLSDQEQLERTKRRMERQQQAQGIRLKYIDEFATVLTAQQVSRFYSVEDHILKKLRERREHAKGQSNGNHKDGQKGAKSGTNK